MIIVWVFLFFIYFHFLGFCCSFFHVLIIIRAFSLRKKKRGTVRPGQTFIFMCLATPSAAAQLSLYLSTLYLSLQLDANFEDS